MNNGWGVCMGQGQKSCVYENKYAITYTQAGQNQPVIPQTCLLDAPNAAGVQAYRCWGFWWNTIYPWGLSLPVQASRWATQNAATALTHDQMWWTTEATQGNVYLDKKLTTTDGTVYSQMTQAVDAYGNVTETDVWDYSTAAPSGAATRVYKSAFDTRSGFLGASIL